MTRKPEMPDYPPGTVMELCWYPAEGERFTEDAYAGQVGEVTEFVYRHGRAKITAPARILDAAVSLDGLSVTIRLQIEAAEA